MTDLTLCTKCLPKGAPGVLREAICPKCLDKLLANVNWWKHQQKVASGLQN